MRIEPVSHVDLPTASGPMRTHLFRPVQGKDLLRKFPAVILFSEIYQMTGPIARTAAMIAGQGFIVAVPEVYHEFAEPGEVFAYDKLGTDRGNELKTTKELSSYDADARAVIDFLSTEPTCSGRVGTLGVCLGGHLAFRAAMNAEVRASVCCYATDIHKRSLGKGMHDDSLDRVHEIQGALMMVWGRQDPHVPAEGRRIIYDALNAAGTSFTWHEFNGEHAFLRDEGHRYDPALAHCVFGMAFQHFAEHLHC
jgi:carboxymethylenebutenolidase